MKGLLAFVGWTLPPVAFFAWLLWTIAGVQNAAIPAFGSVDTHLAVVRTSLLHKMAVGALLALGWTGCWTYLKRARALGRSRRKARVERASRYSSSGF